MKRTSIIFTLLAGFIVLVIWYGYSIPIKHTVSISKHYNKTTAEIWSTIAEYEKYPEWHEDVYAIKKLPPHGGYPSWKEVDADGNTVRFIITKSLPNIQLVIQAKIKSIEFTYRRTYDLIPDTIDKEKGTTLRITQEGKINNFLFRIIAHFITGHTTELDTFLRSMTNMFASNEK